MTRFVLLGDIAKIGDGLHGTPKYDLDGTIPFINGNNLVDGSVVVRIDTKMCSVNEFSKHDKKLSRNAVLISINGTIGNVAKFDGLRYLLGKSACYIDINDETLISQKYLYYLCRTKEFQDYIINEATGSTIKNVPLKAIRNYRFKLPSSTVQNKTTDILSAIDEKIELNRKMNETLEQMGQALFRHYLIDNLDVDRWELKSLGDFVELVNGSSYKSSELLPSQNALVTLKSVGRGGGFSRRGYKEFTGKFKDTQIVHDGDLVVAHTDLTQKAEVAGYPALVEGTGDYDRVAISMDLVKVVPRNRTMSTALAYFILKSRKFQEHKMGYINGSTVLHLNKACIPDYLIALPSDANAISRISADLDGLMGLIKEGNQQAQTLTSLRDTLIPKLIHSQAHHD